MLKLRKSHKGDSWLILCNVQAHLISLSPAASPKHPLTSSQHYLLTSPTFQSASGTNQERECLRIAFIFSTPLANIVPHLHNLIRMLADFKANRTTIRTPLISMQPRKWLIPKSLSFFHMRSLEIAPMSQLLLGGRKGEGYLKSRNPAESYQWSAFCC